MGPEREGTWRSSGVGDGRAIGCLEVSPRGIFDSSRGADVLFRLFCMGFQSGCLAGAEFSSSAKKKNHRRSCVALASRRLPTIFQSLRGARHLTTAPKATEQDGSGLEARYVCLPAGRRGRPRAPLLLERGRLRLSPSCHETARRLGLPPDRGVPRPLLRDPDLTSRPPIPRPTVVLTKKKPTGGMNGVPKSAEAVRALPRTLAKFLVSLFRVR